jgi:hypothetical protein
MATPKPFHLTVSIRPKPILPALRNATFRIDKKIGYRYFEFDDEVIIQDTHSIPEIMEAVLNLITPTRALNVEEQKMLGVGENSTWLAVDDLEPDKAEEFLNTYGQIGLANYYRREKMTRLMSPSSFMTEAKISYKHLDTLKEEHKDNSALFYRRIDRIWQGKEIPFSWVEDDLRRLAKCIRMKLAIDKNRSEGYEEILITDSKQFRRIIHAWDRSGFAIPGGKDSGNYRPLDKSWSMSQRHKESILQDFVSAINNFLRPVSQAITTEAIEELVQKNSGIETAICYEVFSRLEPLLERICANPKCKKPYLIERSTKTFCSDGCASYVRGLRHKAKNKKVSATRAGSKKKRKVGKK